MVERNNTLELDAQHIMPTSEQDIALKAWGDMYRKDIIELLPRLLSLLRKYPNESPILHHLADQMEEYLLMYGDGSTHPLGIKPLIK